MHVFVENVTVLFLFRFYLIDGLGFTVRNSKGKIREFGPFGGRGGKLSNIKCEKVVAVWCRSGKLVDSVKFNVFENIPIGAFFLLNFLNEKGYVHTQPKCV